MWKARPEEKPSGSAAPAPSTTNIGTNTNSSANNSSNTSVSAAVVARPALAPQRSGDNYRAEVAHIGKSVLIKGELSGSEDLYLDGEVEGSVDLKQHSLTVGPHAAYAPIFVPARSLCTARSRVISKAMKKSN